LSTILHYLLEFLATTFWFLRLWLIVVVWLLTCLCVFYIFECTYFTWIWKYNLGAHGNMDAFSISLWVIWLQTFNFCNYWRICDELLQDKFFDSTHAFFLEGNGMKNNLLGLKIWILECFFQFFCLFMFCCHKARVCCWIVEFVFEFLMNLLMFIFFKGIIVIHNL